MDLIDDGDQDVDDGVQATRVPSGRLKTGMAELDRLLGGGLIRDGVVMLTGFPGAGKSTLAMQVLGHIARRHRVLYVTGEETERQVRARARRVGLTGHMPRIFATTDADEAIEAIEGWRPAALVFDSAQALETAEAGGSAGGPSQTRAVTKSVVAIAKRMAIATILVSHVTKDGTTAGPQTVAHAVDAHLHVDWDESSRYRSVRMGKNRYGTSDIAMFEMTASGLREVAGASEVLLADRLDMPGTAVCPVWTGSRALLLEIQAMVTPKSGGVPKRACYGVSAERVAKLLGALERRGQIVPSEFDVIVNVAGGVQATEPATDLAIAAAILGAARGIKHPPRIAWVGEIGILGEVRAVDHLHERASECAAMRFELLACSARQAKSATDLRVSTLGVQDIMSIAA